MAHVTADRVRDTSTTTGTGAFAVSGTAPTGYRTFSAVLTTNDTCWYAIQHQSAAEWEVGLGTYSSANTITRTTVLASSNSGSAVSFSAGTKDVFITLAAAKTVQLDASDNASALGIVASATLTNATGLPISTGVSGLGTGVATFLATPSSANLASAVTDETGSGALVFGTSPSFTTSALFPDGTASAPSIGHAGDTNTGFYFPAADTIAASTAGSEAMRITSTGNVGIGTTNLSTISFRVTKNITGSTTAYLSRYDGTVQPDVTGTSYGSAVVVGTAANGGTPYTTTNIFNYNVTQGAFNADSTVSSQYGYSVNGNLIGATNNFGFHISNTAAVTTGKTSYGFYSSINTATGGGTTYQLFMAGTANSYINGNLGIGTSSPDATLTVNTIASFGDGAVTTPSIAHKGDLNTGFWFPAADTIAASTAGSERMRITSSGNVGIGTSSFGTSAVSVLGIATGTAPTTGPADTIQIYSTDLSAGNTMLSLYTEGTPVNANTTAATTHRIAIRVNGTVYYLLANTAA